MEPKICIERIKEHIGDATNRSDLARRLGVSKQYLDFFIKSRGIIIESKIHFRIRQSPRD
jgi:hypothetical protein